MTTTFQPDTMSDSNFIFKCSPHLFWDVKREEIDVDKNKSYIIGQVLEYGKLKDWKLILSYYGMEQIARTAMNFRSLEKKALSFISQLSGIPKEQFRCYTYQQSIPPHWNF
ncbi:MAG: hypothetical protein IEMM0006_2141 [bacterium]|nr:MAG: hypothetical protein IEMM0006_2141 [bacterium]